MKLERGFDKVEKNGKLKKKLDKVKEIADEEYDMYSKITSQLDSEGIKQFDNVNVNEDYLQLPTFLTEIDSKELGKYFSAFTMQRMWVRTVRGRVKASIKEIEGKLDDIRRTTYAGLPVKMSIKEKEIALLDSNKAISLINERRFLEAKLDIVNDYIDSLEDGIHNISREITRRGKDFDDDGRGRRI